GDIRARGFMLGATAGRTTLAGEGLQHQDGHSLLMAAAHPTLLAYDPAFLFEIAVIIRDGIRRMVAQNEDVLYYLTLHNENYPMSGMPEGSEQGILEGLYKFRAGICQAPKARAQIFGSGAILREALRAQEILAEQFGVNAEVWSATSYKRLRSGAVAADRWNRLHPGEPAQKSYLERVLADQEGPFVAVSDHVRLVADQIAPWVPGGMTTLGTDGYGCSDIRKRLRRYFEVDAEMIAIAVLQSLSQKGKIETDVVTEAIRRLGVDPEKAFPVFI
ncbi:MAG: pyruvate dehydrogenase (acetyl-transferring), homodimeric type, partial [Candidatus Omnitrophota bacterium]